MAIRYLTSGESHGEKLNAIIDGIPFGYELDFDFINSELSQRQEGVGRGGRMKIEKDKIKINSGVRYSITTASPISIEIQNKDWQNWIYPMSVEKLNFDTLPNEIKSEIEKKVIKNFRPAHADYAGCVKYNFEDIRYVLERSSARETASKVAIGAICQCILKKYNIEFSSEIIQIGKCKKQKEFEEYIKLFQQKGDSLGGIIKLTIKNVPVGLGSFVQWDKKLDGRLAQSLMSIQAIKSVEFGLGKKYAEYSGYNSHDELYFENKICHKTNNSGGIEGGMSNGEAIVITLAMKPIPTIKQTLNSVEIKTHKKVLSHFERSDNCAVYAAGVVARNVAAITILDAFLEKFGNDCKKDIDLSYKNYKMRINET